MSECSHFVSSVILQGKMEHVPPEKGRESGTTENFTGYHYTYRPRVRTHRTKQTGFPVALALPTSNTNTMSAANDKHANLSNMGGREVLALPTKQRTNQRIIKRTDTPTNERTNELTNQPTNEQRTKERTRQRTNQLTNEPTHDRADFPTHERPNEHTKHIQTKISSSLSSSSSPSPVIIIVVIDIIIIVVIVIIAIVIILIITAESRTRWGGVAPTARLVYIERDIPMLYCSLPHAPRRCPSCTPRHSEHWLQRASCQPGRARISLALLRWV